MIFSIILPVYNSEKFLDRTINSVLDQSYSNFELIIIDDKSTDNSLKIANKFQKKDARIRLIAQSKNKGVANARNIGLEKVKGEYILFLDSDDTLPINALKYYKNEIDKTGADIIQSQILIKGVQGHNKNYLKVKNKIYNNTIVIKKFLNFRNVSGYVGGKVYKKDIVKNIRFKESMQYGEDGAFMIECLSKIKKFEIANFDGYSYLIRNDSLSRRGMDYSRNNLDVFKQIKYMQIYIPTNFKKYKIVFTFEMYRSELQIFKNSSDSAQHQYRFAAKKMKKFCDDNWLKVVIVAINPRIKLNALRYGLQK